MLTHDPHTSARLSANACSNAAKRHAGNTKRCKNTSYSTYEHRPARRFVQQARGGLQRTGCMPNKPEDADSKRTRSVPEPLKPATKRTVLMPFCIPSPSRPQPNKPSKGAHVLPNKRHAVSTTARAAAVAQSHHVETLQTLASRNAQLCIKLRGKTNRQLLTW